MLPLLLPLLASRNTQRELVPRLDGLEELAGPQNSRDLSRSKDDHSRPLLPKSDSRFPWRREQNPDRFCVGYDLYNAACYKIVEPKNLTCENFAPAARRQLQRAPGYQHGPSDEIPDGASGNIHMQVGLCALLAPGCLHMPAPRISMPALYPRASTHACSHLPPTYRSVATSSESSSTRAPATANPMAPR